MLGLLFAAARASRVTTIFTRSLSKRACTKSFREGQHAPQVQHRHHCELYDGQGEASEGQIPGPSRRIFYL